MARTVQLMSNTGTELNVTGTKQKADAYFGNTDGLHTVGIYMNEFVGRIFIQGSLAIDPSDDDWFNITLDGEVNSYLQYSTMTTGDGLNVYNFTGNFVWIRAKIDRSYIIPEPDPNSVGYIEKILMSH